MRYSNAYERLIWRGNKKEAAISDIGVDIRAKWLSLGVLCSGIFLAAVDQTVVVTVLPRIIDDLEGGFSSSAVERSGWIVISYLFGYTVVLPLMGRVADRFGTRRTYNYSIALFALGSTLCAVSWSLYALVGFRAIQAVGGGAVVPITMAVAGHELPPNKRALAMGLIGAAAEAGGVFGPLYGAVLGQYIGWRAIFYLNIPLVLFIIWLVRRYVSAGRRFEASIDYRSGLLLALALGAATLGISGAKELGWTNFGLPLIGAGVIFLALFVISELRSNQPLIDPSLYGNRVFTAANAAHLLLGVALITALVQVPTFAYISVWPDQPPDAPMTGGLLLIRLTLMIPFGAIVGGYLTNRAGSRFCALAGFMVSALGLWHVSRWQVDVDALRETADLMVTGFGFGLVIAPIGLSVLNSVRKSRMASGSALLTASRIIGMTLGLAAINSWGISHFQTALSAFPLPTPRLGISFSQYTEELGVWEQRNVQIILGVLSDFFMIAAVACLLALIPSWFLLRRLRKNGTIRR